MAPGKVLGLQEGPQPLLSCGDIDYSTVSHHIVIESVSRSGQRKNNEYIGYKTVLTNLTQRTISKRSEKFSLNWK
mgnify:CR=1 FL=1